MKELTKEWIAKAENDHLVAIRELKADPVVTDAVCFQYLRRCRIKHGVHQTAIRSSALKST